MAENSLTLRVVRADPAGNLTLFVLDPVAPEHRPAVTHFLLHHPDLHAEQLAYLVPSPSDLFPRMHMAGGEFCGNATRAFLLLLMREFDLESPMELDLYVSGTPKPVHATADLEQGTAYAQMPLPQLVKTVEFLGQNATLVHLGGIAHLVVEHLPPDPTAMEVAEPLFAQFPDLEAYGIMFFDRGAHTMTPLVKVPAAQSLCWEGSCGSGSVACALAAFAHAPDGSHKLALQQPAGTLEVELTLQNGTPTSITMGGTVSLEETTTVTVPL